MNRLKNKKDLRVEKFIEFFLSMYTAVGLEVTCKIPSTHYKL